jgi:ADP-heptose:LPS heptosyltransferase
MVINTKTKGNKAEAIVLAEFIKNNIPVLLPFGDNEKYDLVIDINGQFKSVQIKYGRISNGCVTADIRHRTGAKRISYETYYDKVDFIAIWCEENNKVYLISLKEFGNKVTALLRIDSPKNNSCISTICWDKDYEFDKILQKYIVLE